MVVRFSVVSVSPDADGLFVPGQTSHYQALSRQLNKPDAVRAVANANGANRVAIVIPCHRFIGKDGTMTGYGGGVAR